MEKVENPIPNSTPDNVAAPSHFLLFADFGKKRNTSANQKDSDKSNGHHPHKGMFSIFHPASAENDKQITSAAKRAPFIPDHHFGLSIFIRSGNGHATVH